jgi:hypothetical protein
MGGGKKNILIGKRRLQITTVLLDAEWKTKISCGQRQKTTSWKEAIR